MVLLYITIDATSPEQLPSLHGLGLPLAVDQQCLAVRKRLNRSCLHDLSAQHAPQPLVTQKQ